MGDDGERLPRSHSEWCILCRVDISVLSQAESSVLRLIQSLRVYFRNNVAFSSRVRICLMNLCLNTGEDIRSGQRASTG